ncbi:MAG: hypothetical protein AABX53_01245 [Nanoarchaeota archaeon]
MQCANIVNEQLATFIKEAKKRGFDNHEIRQALAGEGWTNDEIEHAFEYTTEKRAKNQVCIYLDNIVLAKIEKRAKRNLLTTSKQIEDIVRRSAVNTKGTTVKPEKLDDLLISIFSRKTRKR